MSLSRTWRLLRKDLAMGPRSPIFLYAVILPFVATLLVNVVFGSLFDPKPRLGIVDEGASRLAREARDLEGIQVVFSDSEAELREQVMANDLDAGLVLQEGFDDAVRAGEQPKLNFFIGGESLASNRIILVVTAFDMVRDVAGSPAPIEVAIETTGEGGGVPLASRLVPVLVMFAILIAGVFVPASGLVEEKEHNTLDAVLVTPVQISDVLLAKGALGFFLAMATGTVTLALNNAFTANPLALILVLAVAALMSVEFGLMLGSWAKDTNMLFTAAKGANFFLMLPVFFFIWPDLPQWIPRLMPTYYFLSPLYEIAILNASLADVSADIGIGLGLCALLILPVLRMGRRMEAVLASG